MVNIVVMVMIIMILTMIFEVENSIHFPPPNKYGVVTITDSRCFEINDYGWGYGTHDFTAGNSIGEGGDYFNY
jgi:hypothetical protein